LVPSITSWAQINGGNLITREEKGALDDWYIRYASLWLDVRIALLTLRVLFTGERRSNKRSQRPMRRAVPRAMTGASEGDRLGAATRRRSFDLSHRRARKHRPLPNSDCMAKVSIPFIFSERAASLEAYSTKCRRRA
jgi:hypothetical protein